MIRFTKTPPEPEVAEQTAEVEEQTAEVEESTDDVEAGEPAEVGAEK